MSISHTPRLRRLVSMNTLSFRSYHSQSMANLRRRRPSWRDRRKEIDQRWNAARSAVCARQGTIALLKPVRG